MRHSTIITIGVHMMALSTFPILPELKNHVEFQRLLGWVAGFTFVILIHRFGQWQKQQATQEDGEDG